jgi:hypothetical protein
MGLNTLTTTQELLKDVYLPAIREQLNNDTALSDLIDTNEEDVSGKNALIVMHHGRTGGTGARPDAGTLPAAGNQETLQCEVPMKYNYGRIQVSGPMMAATRDDRGAYARALTHEIQGVTTDLMKEINRQLWGAGYGVLARWDSGTTTSHTLCKAYTNASDGSGFGCTFGAKYLKENGHAVPVVMTFSSGVTAAAVDDTDINVSAVTKGTTYDTITCSDPGVTEAAGTFYVRGDANDQAMTSLSSATTGSGDGRHEMMGLRGIVTNTNVDDISFFNASSAGFAASSAPAQDWLQGVDADAYTWFQSTVDTHSGGRYTGQRQLTFNLMDKMFDAVEEEAGVNVGPDSIWTTRAIRREYLELCRADRREVNQMTLDGGWKGLEFNGIPLMVDTDAIDGEMYFLTLSHLQIYRMSDYDWMSRDGSILSRVSGKDAYEATLFRYAEMGTDRRNCHGVLCDLAYTL